MAYYLFGLLDTIVFFWHCKRHHLYLASWALSRCTFCRLHSLASLGSSIFYFASPPCPSGQYLSFGPSDNIIFDFSPRLRPSGIFFLLNPTAASLWQNIFLFGPTVAPLQEKKHLITHKGFLQAAFCKLPWCPFLPGSSRLPLISVGVTFLATPCNK